MPYQVWYRRFLPHWQPADAPLFITWRLHGSLPATAIAQLSVERARINHDPRSQDPHSDWAINQHKQFFAHWDTTLHTADGPHWLAQPDIAASVRNELHRGEKENLYCLYAYTIMSNHVHVLLQPLDDPQTGQPIPLSRIMQTIKGRTARQANLKLNREGHFWTRESYDHWARNEAELQRIVAYILNNPVKAGLVEEPLDWPWSWISPRFQAQDSG